MPASEIVPVAQDLLDELGLELGDLVDLKHLRALLPGQPSAPTMYRMVSRGQVPCLPLGGRMYSHPRLIIAQAERVSMPAKAPTPKQRERAIERAEREAAELGF